MPMRKLHRLTESDVRKIMANRVRSASPDVVEFIRETSLPGSPDDPGAAEGPGSRVDADMASKEGGAVSELEETLALHMRAVGIPDPMREYKFDPKRRWRADFAWPDRLLLVEVEGGHWTGGRHTRGSGFDKDCEKYNEAALFGWRVIRVTSTHVRTGEALAWIVRALA